ncbi:MAG: hypothetical protein ACHQ7H_02305 [Candidatus Rokuibacteriota bacterium]
MTTLAQPAAFACLSFDPRPDPGRRSRELELVGQTGNLHEVGDRVERIATLNERVAHALGDVRRDFTG